jgi:hypothetical protein
MEMITKTTITAGRGARRKARRAVTTGAADVAHVLTRDGEVTYVAARIIRRVSAWILGQGRCERCPCSGQVVRR